MSHNAYPQTPDGRYFVARGRLWRKTNPELGEATREYWVKQLMAARRAVKHAENGKARQKARAEVQSAKEALGERGPVWWDDGAPDETRRAPKNSRYAAWWAGLAEAHRAVGR